MRLSKEEQELAQKRMREADQGQSPPPPALVFAALFGERLDPYLQERVSRAYRDEAAASTLHESQRGYLYAFRDARDPPGLVKIGRTSQRPARRLAQWRAELEDPAVGGGPSHIQMLFALETRAPILAERVVHTLLWCRQAVARVNRRTGRLLTEYFFVPEPARLRRLCAALTRHVNAFVAALEARTSSGRLAAASQWPDT